MDLQKPIDYKQMFHELLMRRAQLVKQRDDTEVELVKVAQLIGAVYPLLSDELQRSYKGTVEQIENESGGLQDAIKLVFSQHEGELLSPSKVREYLLGMGFDFRHYQANPLSSIGTTLKRMVPSYLESKNTADGMAFRRAPTPGSKNALRNRAFYGELPPLDDDKIPDELRAAMGRDKPKKN